MIKQAVFDEVMKLSNLNHEICHELWNHPETGGTKTHAADYLRKILADEGFSVINEPKLEHAFYAEYGNKKPVIAVKRFWEQSNRPGTVRFYGCPEEELLSRKVKMAYYRMFDGCDAAITWHPMSTNTVYNKPYLANASVHFSFKGVTSHAAFAQERGRSALDAAELLLNLLGF